MERCEIGVSNHLEALVGEALHLIAIVYDVAEAIERLALGQFLLSLADGGHYPEAEARIAVNLNAHGENCRRFAFSML